MDGDRLMRRALWTTAAFNCAAGVLVAFPSSLGRLAALPVPVPRLYSTLLALFIFLFGGAYAWLARQPRIDRPLVALAALGKTGVFVAVVLLWLVGEAPVEAAVAAGGDLGFAAIFAWWLVTTRGR
jgi:hypothetical protein